ncbi:helix-turn-helix domain-containing protein [Leptospira sp. 201903071]|uniref:helix-turn-helix domain-containing protein n=1 Tax=Leptospira ainazelensis TaxID=2810034 RepID=UPI001963E1A5|nr:helix-turn-helix domain-containing protein [Leptospira ainazelensis]MBM9499686.1 helix-turn-helix domain-containing protein [Leptospira ainazelensis]
MEKKQAKRGQSGKTAPNKKSSSKQDRKVTKAFEPPYENPYKNVDPEQFKVILLLLDGQTIAQTAKVIGVADSTIKRWLYSEETVALRFREAYEKEAARRIDAMRMNADLIAFDLYGILKDWIAELKKRKGKVSSKEIQQVISHLSSSKYLLKNKTEAESESARKKLLSGLEAFLEEKILETISTGAGE